MTLKLDLTKKAPRPLTVVDEATGETLRFTFKRVLNRQQRSQMTKTVGRGRNKREVADLDRLYKSTIETIEGVDVEGAENGVVRDPNVIAKIMVTPENLGGLCEETVEQVTAYVLGENILQEDEGNT